MIRFADHKSSNAQRISDEAWERMKSWVMQLYDEDWTREEIRLRLREVDGFEELTPGQMDRVMRIWGLEPKKRKRSRPAKNTRTVESPETENPVSPTSSSSTPSAQTRDMQRIDQSLFDMMLENPPSMPLESIQEDPQFAESSKPQAHHSTRAQSLPNPGMFDSYPLSFIPQNTTNDAFLYDPASSIRSGSSSNSHISFKMYSEWLRKFLRRRRDSDSIRSRSTTDSGDSNALARAMWIAPTSSGLRYDAGSSVLNGI